jgi:hypothetical protein
MVEVVGFFGGQIGGHSSRFDWSASDIFCLICHEKKLPLSQDVTFATR